MVSAFVFSWNTQSVRIGEDIDPAITDRHRAGYLSGYRWECAVPDFYGPIERRILERDYDLLVFGFQEDASPGSYFHSHFLPAALGKVGYKLVKRVKMMGLGITTYKALKQGDLLTRGLRLSVYAKAPLAEQMLDLDVSLSILLRGPTVSQHVTGSALTRGKGAVACYVRVPMPSGGIYNLAIVNAHLPFDSASLLDSVVQNNPMIRHTAVLQQDQAFNSIYRALVLDLPAKMQGVLFFGDMNYRVRHMTGDQLDDLFASGSTVLSSTTMAASVGRGLVMANRDERKVYRKLYRLGDELRRESELGNVYPMLEGVDDQGPDFLPTCKLYKNRPDLPSAKDLSVADGVFKTGLVGQRMPSWTDRILYNGRVSCLDYDRFDHGQTMKKSDHAAVLGDYVLE